MLELRLADNQSASLQRWSCRLLISSRETEQHGCNHNAQRFPPSHHNTKLPTISCRFYQLWHLFLFFGMERRCCRRRCCRRRGLSGSLDDVRRVHVHVHEKVLRKRDWLCPHAPAPANQPSAEIFHPVIRTDTPTHIRLIRNHQWGEKILACLHLNPVSCFGPEPMLQPTTRGTSQVSFGSYF